MSNREGHQFHPEAKPDFGIEVSDECWPYILWMWLSLQKEKFCPIYCVHLKQQVWGLLPVDRYITQVNDITRKMY